MDKHDVLSISFNADKLDKDLYDWSSLPEDRRTISDKICLETYGCTNKQLYNKLKSCILLGKTLDTSSTSINESYYYGSIDRSDLVYRIGLAKSMNNSNVLTAILYPYDPELISDSNYKEKYKEEFVDIYNRFIRLSDKYQKYSNLYSIQLFGYNVRSMYQLIAPDLTSKDESDTLVLSRDYIDSYASTLEESITEDLVYKNVIPLFKFQIMHSTDSIYRASMNDIFARMLENEVSGILVGGNSKNDLKTGILPFFTISEFNSILDDSDIELDKTIDFKSLEDSRVYYKTVTELYDKFIDSNKSDKIIENTLLSIGWNPYVDPRTSIDKVRERQIKWFNEHCAHLIDLSDIEVNTTKSLSESSMLMNKKYEELDLYPVYIVLSYSDSTFAKVIRKVKSSTYCHAGLCLDSNLQQILTFEFIDKNNKGYEVESVGTYVKENNDSIISVLCLFVDSVTISKLQDSISYFVSNKKNSKYNFKNLINILMNKVKDNDPYNLSMVCSQFVDTILKLADINITNKSSNLVIPQDFEDISHPNVYKLYDGLARKYNELKVEGKIELMLNTSTPEDIRYSSLVSELCLPNWKYNLLSKNYRVTDNDKVNNILSEFYNYLSPIRNRIRTSESTLHHEDELI